MLELLQPNLTERRSSDLTLLEDQMRRKRWHAFFRFTFSAQEGVMSVLDARSADHRIGFLSAARDKSYRFDPKTHSPSISRNCCLHTKYANGYRFVIPKSVFEESVTSESRTLTRRKQRFESRLGLMRRCTFSD